jgi:hypothetical protein
MQKANMKKALSIILRGLGFNRPKPKTRLGGHLRRSEHCVTVLCFVYLGLHLFPQALFPNSAAADGITIYSRHALTEDAYESARKAAELLRASELYDSNRTEKIFVCDSQGLFRFFVPRSASAFGASVGVTNHVFIASADFTNDTAWRFGDRRNTRSLSSVIAHEVTHGLIRNRVGLIKEIRSPACILEGYCEYIAGEGSFPEEEGMRLFLSGEEEASGSYRYFVYRLVVQYLIENQHLTFMQIFDRTRDYDATKNEVREHLRKAAATGTPVGFLAAEGREITVCLRPCRAIYSAQRHIGWREHA